jgi:hypothetical protein
MLPQKLTKMAEGFRGALHLNKARAVCLAAACYAALEAKSITLSEIAKRIPGKAKTSSKFRRAQRFFLEVALDFKQVALLILSLGDISLQVPMVLALDRTNWSTRDNEVNLLTLSVCTGDVGLPLFWKDLRQKGNSSTAERVGIIRRFVSFFGVERIKCLVGDREFIGKQWFSWLITQNVPFVMRLKGNTLLEMNGRKSAIKHFFHHMSNNSFQDMGLCHICGVNLYVCCVKNKTGELIILASHGISGKDAAAMYLLRWNIETGFEKLKTHGFNMEASRLRGEGKMELLLAILAISMAWCYSCGKKSEAYVPIKLKSHGRKEQSVFRRGLEVLGAWSLGIECEWRRLFKIVVAIFTQATAFVASALPASPVNKIASRRWI